MNVFHFHVHSIPKCHIELEDYIYIYMYALDCNLGRYLDSYLDFKRRVFSHVFEYVA